MSSDAGDRQRRVAVATPSPLEEPAAGARRLPGVLFADASIWRNQNFLLLWLAQAISQTAQNAIWYGIVVLVQRVSNSSTQLSLAVLTLIIPSVVFGVLAGVYVDRWDKRTVLIATNLIRGAIAFSYATFGLVALLPLSSLYLINFLFSTVGQFFAPAETAMIPSVVGKGRLLQANSLFHLTFTASQLVGLVVLGPLLAKIGGVNGLFVSMAIAIMLCGGLVWPLPSTRGAHDPSLPSSEQEAIRGVWHDVRDIWHFVFRDRVVALAMVQWTIGAILGLVVATLVPGFAERLLHVRAEDAVFVSRLGTPFTRFGVYRLIERCAAGVPELADRTITPHVIRHTTACHLVLAGVDINTIRAWLGHVSISTTNIYAEIDLTLKANAVALCEVGQPRPGRSWKEDKDLMVFLKSL